MVMRQGSYTKLLIYSVKVILTFIFVFETIGSYTYSEVRTDADKDNLNLNSSLLLQKLSTKGIPFFCLVPTSYKPIPNSSKIKIIPSENIMDIGIIKLNALANFLRNSNKSIDLQYASSLAKLYIDEATKEGVNYDIAFTQMCLETGFLRFGGDVQKTQNNFCGLGVTGNGVEGLSFKNIQDGVRAHIQHLKAYASTHELNNKLIDKRFNYVKRGSATNISELTGSWASDKKYDKKIRNLLTRLYK